jgi:hypothetical protein
LFIHPTPRDISDIYSRVHISGSKYGIDKTEAYCCGQRSFASQQLTLKSASHPEEFGRCNVYVDENNIITEIIDFG